jgi:uncharacterized repeat protein (TIGR01451 family)
VSRALVLTSITVDGNMSDWSAVNADPFQFAQDGPAGGLIDRDAPVGSTGRDLTAFSWTWDSTYLFFYVARAASDSNRQRWWFYLDLNEDGKMSSTEYVVGVSWQGSNRATDTTLYQYVPVSSAGDSLGDAAGFADGWDMPGSATSILTIESGFGGAANGVEMEARIAWSRLGVPSGTPVKFHVSASNNTNLPSGILDNMAGPGGKIGWMRSFGVRLDPDRSTTSTSPGHVVFAHTASNLGSSGDTINFAWSSSGGFAPASLAFYRDANANGLLDAGDPALTDTDGDTRLDTGAIAAGGASGVLFDEQVPGGQPEGRTASITVIASSSKGPAYTDPATDTVTIATPALTLLKSVDKAEAHPGETLSYTIQYLAAGSTPSYAVKIIDPIPADVAYVAGSAAGAGMTITFSHDGGVTYDGSDAAPVTHIRWQRTSPLAPGGSGTTSFQAAVR